MNYDRIILELLDRVQALEEKVEALEGREVVAEPPLTVDAPAALAVDFSRVSPKYRKLAEYLVASGERRMTLTYPEIERILGFALPDSARNHMHAYWANTYTHSYATSWLVVGYKTRVNPDDGTVTFERNTL